MANKKYEEAVADFTEALNYEEDKLSCIFNRGVCYFALEKDEEAKKDLTYVVEDGTDPSLTASSLELLKTIEEMERAEEENKS